MIVVVSILVVRVKGEPREETRCGPKLRGRLVMTLYPKATRGRVKRPARKNSQTFFLSIPINKILCIPAKGALLRSGVSVRSWGQEHGKKRGSDRDGQTYQYHLWHISDDTSTQYLTNGTR